MTRGTKFLLSAGAVLIAVFLMIWEVSLPVTAVHFMLVLHRLDLRVLAIIAPFGVASILTGAGLLFGARAARTGRRFAWVWLVVAYVVAPTVALGGHWVATALLGSRPV
jgi:hypothetical protein